MEEVTVELTGEDIAFLKQTVDRLRDVVERMRPVNLNMGIPQARVFAWWRETLDFGIKDVEDKLAEWNSLINQTQEKIKGKKEVQKEQAQLSKIVKLKKKAVRKG